MAYVVSGAPATLTSVTGSSMPNQLLMSGSRQLSFGVSKTGDSEETTPLDGSTLGATMLSGLRSGVVNFDGMIGRSSPALGNTGLITLDSSLAGYAVRLREWELTIDFGEEDITGFNGTPPTWKVFRPGGKYNWSGRFAGMLLSDANAGVPSAPGATGAAATFKLLEGGANDPSFSGNIIIPGIEHTVNRSAGNQPVAFTYMGSGALTETKGSSLAGLLVAATGVIARTTGAGAEGPTDWDLDADGVPDVSAVFTYASGVTDTVPVFLKTATFRCAVGVGLRVTGQLRMAGACVPAP